MKKVGFTLIELLIVIAILGILSVVVFTSLQSAREGARSAAAVQQLQKIYDAIRFQHIDTGLYPNNLTYLCEPLDEISSTNEFRISDPSTGLVTNGRGWAGWGGPYMATIPLDPWGNEYYFDDDYRCLAETLGCNGVEDPSGRLNSSAIVSCGPNGVVSSGSCSYDADNIVFVLCRR